MSDDSDLNPEQPTIQFAGEWIPAHEAWKKMETATVVVDAIAEFNDAFPYLATDETRAVVPLVRQRLKDIQVRMPQARSELPSLGNEARELLNAMPPEDVVDHLRETHGASMDLLQFVRLVGDQAYLDALGREAIEYELNGVSEDQTAQLWNDARRPAPGGGLWSGHKISDLLTQYR